MEDEPLNEVDLFPSLNLTQNGLKLSGEKYAIKAIRIRYENETKFENSNKQIESRAEISPNVYEEQSSIFDEILELFTSNGLQFNGFNTLEAILEYVGEIGLNNLPKQVLEVLLQKLPQNLNFQNLALKASDILTEKLPKMLPNNFEDTLKQGKNLWDSFKHLFELSQRRKRNAENKLSVAEDASLTALIYVDMFFRLTGSRENPECVAHYFCMSSKSAKMLGDLPVKLSGYLSDFAADLLIPNYWINPDFLKNVTKLARKKDFECNEKFPDC